MTGRDKRRRRRRRRRVVMIKAPAGCRRLVVIIVILCREFLWCRARRERAFRIRRELANLTFLLDSKLGEMLKPALSPWDANSLLVCPRAPLESAAGAVHKVGIQTRFKSLKSPDHSSRVFTCAQDGQKLANQIKLHLCARLCLCASFLSCA